MLGIQDPALPDDGPRHTQLRSSAPKLLCGRPGNSQALKQSGSLILRRA